MPKTIKGWHFAAAQNGVAVTNPEFGKPTPIHKGTRLQVKGEIAPCRHGLHASVTALDALQYAQGGMVSRVTLSGRIVPHSDPIDKYAASVRTHTTEPVDALPTLVAFAGWCAELATWHAFDAARDARDAAWAAWDARDARDAAWAAQAARAAARDARAVRAAARAAAWAAWDAARAAARAVWAAARAAARDAWDARDAINTKLESMLNDIIEGNAE